MFVYFLFCILITFVLIYRAIAGREQNEEQIEIGDYKY
jgi:hypothetical protein